MVCLLVMTMMGMNSMSKQMQKEFDSNWISKEEFLLSVVNVLLDYLCDVYTPREVVELLASAGFTRGDCQDLRFDDDTISSVFDR